VSWYQKVHFAIFWIFWCKMKMTQADTPTIWMDCHPIQTNWCPISAIPTIFTPYALPGTTLPIYSGLGSWDRHQICWLAYPVTKANQNTQNAKTKQNTKPKSKPTCKLSRSTERYFSRTSAIRKTEGESAKQGSYRSY